MNNGDNNDNRSELERFFNAIAGAGLGMMGLAMFGIIFGNSPPTITISVPVNNRTAEVNSSIKQTGFLNVNFGDAQGENRND